MSEWIPTSERLPNPSRDAVVYATTTDGFVGRWEARRIRDNPEIYLAWMPAEFPEPYVPPKTERKRGHRYFSGIIVDVVEVLPGDPDPDKVIELRDEISSRLEHIRREAESCEEATFLEDCLTLLSYTAN